MVHSKLWYAYKYYELNIIRIPPRYILQYDIVTYIYASALWSVKRGLYSYV